jgi:hypothetical protein
MQVPETIFLDSAIFVEKKRWLIDSVQVGNEQKNSAKKENDSDSFKFQIKDVEKAAGFGAEKIEECKNVMYWGHCVPLHKNVCPFTQKDEIVDLLSLPFNSEKVASFSCLTGCYTNSGRVQTN